STFPAFPLDKIPLTKTRRIAYAFQRLQSDPNSKTWSAKNADTRRKARGSHNRERNGSHNLEDRHSSDGRTAAGTRSRASRTDGGLRELRRFPVGRSNL